MSYPQSLDEIEEYVLTSEVSRRRWLQKLGLCDYCERGPKTDPCKFPERHKRAKERVDDQTEKADDQANDSTRG